MVQQPPSQTVNHFTNTIATKTSERRKLDHDFQKLLKFNENTITYLIVKFALKARGYVDRIQVLQTTFANQVLVDEERTKGRLALSWSAEIGFKTKDRYFFVNCNHFLGLIFVKTNKKF